MADRLDLDDSKYLSRPTLRLLNDFGAGKPSPGSGSAAALMGLLAIKLLITVGIKTKEKDKDADKHRTFQYIEEKLKSLEPTLINLFEKDAKDFDEIVELRRQRDKAKDSTESATFQRKANNLLQGATENVLNVSEICLEVLDYATTSFNEGWPAVRGDSGAAISAASAGATSGLFIANLNIKTLKSRIFANESLAKSISLQEKLQQKQPTIFRCLMGINEEAKNALQLDLQLPLDL